MGREARATRPVTAPDRIQSRRGASARVRLRYPISGDAHAWGSARCTVYPTQKETRRARAPRTAPWASPADARICRRTGAVQHACRCLRRCRACISRRVCARGAGPAERASGMGPEARETRGDGAEERTGSCRRGRAGSAQAGCMRGEAAGAGGRYEWDPGAKARRGAGGGHGPYGRGYSLSDGGRVGYVGYVHERTDWTES
ncbi:hypothetical protein HYPSUDRAFT_1045266 [Hypholoma sublateritium FD-334 SS-4]|uniref:Uncharacterized protein n=1 Tax=Hypholoma sublateritium (strain FD-334 SS-4) TaxID=945553 RepID=A0A0D2M1M0_HYPSF|nr:hypothetical protein HYPSUDRAFT_1045266 [Hypholoma sublateritium FD-334 SS-4]